MGKGGSDMDKDGIVRWAKVVVIWIRMAVRWVKVHGCDMDKDGSKMGKGGSDMDKDGSEMVKIFVRCLRMVKLEVNITFRIPKTSKKNTA